MGVGFEPGPDGVGLDLSSCSGGVVVGSRGEGGGEGVVVRPEVVGRVDLLEEMEGIGVIV